MIRRFETLGLIVAMSVAAAAGAQVRPDGIKDRILRATGTLFRLEDPSVTRTQMVVALADLLDLAAEIMPDGPYRNEIRSRIGVAIDLITKDSPFNDKARQYLSFTYRMMTGGTKFERPKELEEFVTPAELQEKSVRYMRSLVGKALASHDAGNEEDAAKSLVEIVLMTITPVQG